MKRQSFTYKIENDLIKPFFFQLKLTIKNLIISFAQVNSKGSIFNNCLPLISHKTFSGIVRMVNFLSVQLVRNKKNKTIDRYFLLTFNFKNSVTLIIYLENDNSRPFFTTACQFFFSKNGIFYCPFNLSSITFASAAALVPAKSEMIELSFLIAISFLLLLIKLSTDFNIL